MTSSEEGTVQSIRQRLLNRARDLEEDYQVTLVRYGAERFLYRLSLTEWTEHYAVKGATLLDVWLNQPHRPTRDLDMTWVDDGSEEQLESHVRQICAVECPEDGIEFDLSGLTIEPIRRAQEGQGLRARLLARLGRAQINLQLDVGFRDVVTPAPRLEKFPTLLALPAPRVKVYPRETFIAEKFEAMVRFGTRNTRLKDFSDVALLARHMAFDGPVLREACANTFERRGTRLVSSAPPSALQSQFYTEPDRMRSWRAFRAENPSLEHLGSFPKVGEVVASFLTPVWNALASGRSWEAYWKPGGPWNPGP